MSSAAVCQLDSPSTFVLSIMLHFGTSSVTVPVPYQKLVSCFWCIFISFPCVFESDSGSTAFISHLRLLWSLPQKYLCQHPHSDSYPLPPLLFAHCAVCHYTKLWALWDKNCLQVTHWIPVCNFQGGFAAEWGSSCVPAGAFLACPPRRWGGSGNQQPPSY